MSIASTTREIAYDRASRDFAAFLDGNLIGYYPSYLKAEEALDDHVYELLDRGLIGIDAADPVVQMELKAGRAWAATELAPLHCSCGALAVIVDVSGASCGSCAADVNWGS